MADDDAVIAHLRQTGSQIDVFADYVSRHGHAFIDRALYLPKSWMADEDRLAKAHVPAETSFATKPQIAQAMVARAIAAGVPFRWVAADSVYGVGALEMALRRAGKGYVLGVRVPRKRAAGQPSLSARVAKSAHIAFMVVVDDFDFNAVRTASHAIKCSAEAAPDGRGRELQHLAVERRPQRGVRRPLPRARLN